MGLLTRLVYVAIPILLLEYLLVTLPWETELTYGFERVTDPTDESADFTTDKYARTTVYFDSEGTKCEAWLYKPLHDTNVPVVIMAHGLGGQKDRGLHQYADLFASNNVAVFLFDYRTFGGSDGEPRHWVSPVRHLEDWDAAIVAVKKLGNQGHFDGRRMVLWGTSLAGGHVLVKASKYGRNIAAVISQVPHLDGHASGRRNFKERGLAGILRLGVCALHDQARRLLGLSPAYLLMAGSKTDLAYMLLEKEELAGYHARHTKPLLGGWQNRALARGTILISGYSPIRVLAPGAKGVHAPVLIISALQDKLCPPEGLRALAEKLGPTAELVEYDTTHFKMYTKEIFQDSSLKMLEFIQKHTVPKTTLSAPAPALEPLPEEPTATADLAAQQCGSSADNQCSTESYTAEVTAAAAAAVGEPAVTEAGDSGAVEVEAAEADTEVIEPAFVAGVEAVLEEVAAQHDSAGCCGGVDSPGDVLPNDGPPQVKHPRDEESEE